jgi:hypothetical protein
MTTRTGGCSKAATPRDLLEDLAEVLDDER